MPAVFVTNAMLEQWADQGKVRLDDTTLTLLSESRTVKLTAAVRFIKLIDDGAGDPHKLLGKVKTKDQLIELGAEHYLDSVIFGDIGYSVVEGFLGDLSPQKRSASTADPFVPSMTEVRLVAPTVQPPPADLSAAPTGRIPVPVDLPPPSAPAAAPELASEPPEVVSEAEALSRLFLSTVKR